MFWHLNTERRISGGPIPWSAIQEYGDRRGFDPVLRELTEQVIGLIDQTYMKWQAEQIRSG